MKAAPGSQGLAVVPNSPSPTLLCGRLRPLLLHSSSLLAPKMPLEHEWHLFTVVTGTLIQLAANPL